MYRFDPNRTYSPPEAAKILGVTRDAISQRIRIVMPDHSIFIVP